MNLGECLHCLRTRRIRSRGLCSPCAQRPEVREQYPRLKASYRPRGYEPTEEELEAIITEQRANLPKWFREEEERRQRGGRD